MKANNVRRTARSANPRRVTNRSTNNQQAAKASLPVPDVGDNRLLLGGGAAAALLVALLARKSGGERVVFK